MDSGAFLELEGMEELVESYWNMSKETDKSIVNALELVGDDFKKDVVPKIRRSEIIRKPSETTNTWRTGEHAADHITRSKALGKDGNRFVLIGISRGNTSKWFYLKFLEYGTSKMAAQAPFGTTLAEGQQKYYDKIFEVIKGELKL